MQWLIDIIFDKVMSGMKGMILMWSGTLADIPAGWHLCDGTEGTPDLRIKFVIGSHEAFPPGLEGGEWNHKHGFTTDGHQHGTVQHSHEFQGDGHGHTISPGVGIASGENWALITGETFVNGTTDPTAPNTDEQVDTGNTAVVDHVPPYYALAYIMKL